MINRPQCQTMQSLYTPHNREISSFSIRAMVLLACLTAFSGGDLFAATYYVSPSGSDSNPGVQTAPWRTISHAADVMVAGDTTLVQDGTYVTGVIRFDTSGTLENPITLKAQNKWGAIISSTSGANANIEIRGSYVTIDGIKFTLNAANPFPNPPSSLANNAIRCWHTNLPTGPSNPSTGAVGCHVMNVNVDNPFIPGTSTRARGVGFKGSQDNMIVENSTYDAAIEAINCNNAIFRGNLITGTGYYGTPIFAKGGSRNFQAYNNRLQSPGPGGETFNNRGITLGGLTGTVNWVEPGFPDVECFNCIAYNNVAFFPNSVTSFDFVNCANCGFYNNVVFGGQLNRTEIALNPYIRNNIYSCDGSSVSFSGYTGTFTHSHNNYFNCGSTPSQTSAVTGNPLFINAASNWHVQAGSPTIGTGTTIAHPKYGGGTFDLSKDFGGITRTAPWSLGVYAVSQTSDSTPPVAPTNLRIQ